MQTNWLHKEDHSCVGSSHRSQLAPRGYAVSKFRCASSQRTPAAGSQYAVLSLFHILQHVSEQDHRASKGSFLHVPVRWWRPRRHFICSSRRWPLTFSQAQSQVWHHERSMILPVHCRADLQNVCPVCMRFRWWWSSLAVIILQRPYGAWNLLQKVIGIWWCDDLAFFLICLISNMLPWLPLTNVRRWGRACLGMSRLQFWAEEMDTLSTLRLISRYSNAGYCQPGSQAVPAQPIGDSGPQVLLGEGSKTIASAAGSLQTACCAR